MTRLMLAVLLVLGLAACGQAPPPAPMARPAPSAPAGGFGATEQAFVQLEIATDDQAVRMLDEGARRASSTRLRNYARALASSRRGELTELHGLLNAAGVRYENLHAGHDMPGMPTNAELIDLSTTSDVDTTLVALVRAHLTESATVARSAAQAVTHPATRALATRMATARTTSLTELSTLN